jgi:hypothetical protein
MRFKATITRLNSTQATCDVLAQSLTEATQIAQSLIRDGETLCVEPIDGCDHEVIDYTAHTWGDNAS